ncbi:ATP-binding protein [Solirubrobacter ginsenosidimutans]|uniref:ATP-binding protein n=1 Tax=Solirubrobacter ginsenosidimutans TaxID=490573 RepID=A0A9X3MQ10_9ACTN|nr:ATP-binding protein [Solirubrobacter ginsenosidimutans]MDA0160594.1 ATP-binding protein [Solirubrobacter ginsenosidimutans]
MSDQAGSGNEVGKVLGTQDATPLDFWVAINEDNYLQLDDVVGVQTTVPGAGRLTISGVVDMVRARHEGVTFDSDVFLADRGLLPVQTSRAAHVVSTRFEPELYVPPTPGDAVRRVAGLERDQALYFDTMEQRVVAGFARDGEPIYLDLEFIDGRRGAHVNISGVSGIATKTTYASFLLYSLFHSTVLGAEAANTKALIFNVKGEDLLFLDKPNARLTPQAREQYRWLGLPAGPFESVGLWAPVHRGSDVAMPDTGSRQRGVTAYFWTVLDVVRDGLLRFMFAEEGDERSQIADLVGRVEAQLQRHAEEIRDFPASVRLPDADGNPTVVHSFDDLCELIRVHVEQDGGSWRGPIATGTVNAFLRRLEGARFHCGHLIRGRDAADIEQHRVDWRANQVSVIDIHNLHDRAKRFVVGVVIKKLFEAKERSGQARPLVFLVLDELNKYAPREGWSPIKEVLLDIAERGRSLGVILVGAQQTASEVERRVVSNSAIRVVGRLDPAEAERAEYGFLSPTARQRAAILKPGSMLLQQPQIPVPLQITFPFPAWATRSSEVADEPESDPFARFGA